MAIDTDRPDYLNGDEAELVAHVKPALLGWMLFDFTYHGNIYRVWPIDHIHGIEEIIDRTALGLSPYLYECNLLKWIRKDCRSDSCREKRKQAVAFCDTVYSAVGELIREGKLEIVHWFGWPALRLTGVPSNDELRWNPGEALNRADKMRARISALETMPYTEYLQSQEWRHRRDIHLEAAGNRCQLCNSEQKPLHVHHRTYANRGRERFYDLVVLCAVCHEAFHKTGRRIK